MAPDLVAKIAVEPGWGHWEAFGIGRFFRDRIYPIADLSTTGARTTTRNRAAVSAAASAAPLANKKITIGLKGLYGIGVGRYGSSTIADITVRPTGVLEPLKAFSALSTVELNPTKRLNIYFNYGGDYVYRDWVVDPVSLKDVGYGTPTATMYGCKTETYTVDAAGAKSTKNFAAPANCAGDTKDVQEFTAGYWYNIYAGPKGRLRYGLQYSLIRRDLWSGNGFNGATDVNPGGGAHGDDNMVFTSFRYYLP